MRAIAARDIAYRRNRKLKILNDIFADIRARAETGHFILEKEVDSSSQYILSEELTKLGYKISTWSQQTSPNDSDYFIRIDWNE